MDVRPGARSTAPLRAVSWSDWRRRRRIDIRPRSVAACDNNSALSAITRTDSGVRHAVVSYGPNDLQSVIAFVRSGFDANAKHARRPSGDAVPAGLFRRQANCLSCHA